MPDLRIGPLLAVPLSAHSSPAGGPSAGGP